MNNVVPLHCWSKTKVGSDISLILHFMQLFAIENQFDLNKPCSLQKRSSFCYLCQV